MKRLGMLVAALLCVTIGGVYAAWTYAENSGIAPVSKDKGIQLETYIDSQEAPGVYNINAIADASNPVNNEDLFYFDSGLSVENDQANPHKVVLVVNCDIEITFKPSDYASDDIKTGAVDTTVTFSMLDSFIDLAIDGVKLFASFAPIKVNISGVTTTNEVHKWIWDEERDLFTYTITKERLLTHLNYAMNPNFKLESSAEHKAFDTAITGMTIKTTVEKTSV